jgi:drug/metabolite transporter (DMT)-like permease
MKITPSTQNAILLILLACIWGSAFSFVKIAVGSIPPLTLTASRVVLAALLLGLYTRLSGNRLPASIRTWRLCFQIGLTGIAAPFSLVAWGEQYVSSSIAAIGMALVPLTTFILAHFMTDDEKISGAKFAGIVTGFCGVFLLFSSDIEKPGPDLAQSALGVAAILLAVVGYALSGLFSIRLKDVPRPASSAAIMICAAALILPLSLTVDHPWTLSPSWPAIGSAVFLGLLPTALGMVMLIFMVERAGATYFSLCNYLVPVVGLVLGVVWLGEKIVWQTGLAFSLICLGIYLTGRKIPAKIPIPE